MEFFLLHTPAFRTLTAAEIKILLLFLEKREPGYVQRRGDSHAMEIANNGEITLTYSEAGYNPHTVSRALKALTVRGFISLAKSGGFENGHNIPAKYRVHVELDSHQDKDASWRTWKPEKKAPSPSKRTLNLVQFREARQKKATVPHRSGAAVPHRSGEK